MYYGIAELVEDVRFFVYKGDDVIPSPNACLACGIDKRQHAIEASKSRGLHQWIEPTNELRFKRMKARQELHSSQKEAN